MTTVPANEATPPPHSRPLRGTAAESYSYDDTIVRLFATATIVWGLLATLMGLVVALLLVLPQWSGDASWFSFGRLRPLHTNAAIFAFAGNALFAAVYYSTQRLCKARMWSGVLSHLHFWGWQLVIVLAAATLPLGITQGKEYAELQWPIDVLIAVVWILFFGVNFMMTLLRRRERHMYISLWFYISSIVAVSLLHVFNNLVLPLGWWNSYSLYAGVQDAFMQWWYGHNLLAFFLTMPFLGLMYYFLPKVTGRPIYSYRLAIIHFWALVFLYVWAGPHHLHYTTVPAWASSLGMVFGLMLWMPSWGGMLNGLLTLRRGGGKASGDPVVKFFVVGLVFYGLATFEGAMLSIKSVNAFTHYTDWTIAHIHAAALGWNGFMTFGMLYWMLPRLFQTQLWSPKLVKLHFWIGTAGILLYLLPIYAAGAIEGVMWNAMDDTGNLRYPEFLTTLEKVLPLWWLRVLGGALYITGIGMLAVNAFQTWRKRPKQYEVPVHSTPALSAQFVDPAPVRSELEDAPVLEVGKRLTVWNRLSWHRRWERSPIRFTVIVTIVVVLATLAEVLPMFLIRSNVPPVAEARPYTPLELAGRHIYISEGCYNCHSQMVRPLVAETKRYLEYSQPEDSAFDRPVQFGSRRIGPDLAREGGRRDSFWHWRHLENPQQESPGSVMPSYAHLLEADLNFDAIQAHVQAAAALGAPYTEEELTDTAAVAYRQAEEVTADIVQNGGPVAVFDKQVIALIAYLQRLGSAPPAEVATDAAATADEAADSDDADSDDAAADDADSDDADDHSEAT